MNVSVFVFVFVFELFPIKQES